MKIFSFRTGVDLVKSSEVLSFADDTDLQIYDLASNFLQDIGMLVILEGSQQQGLFLCFNSKNVSLKILLAYLSEFILSIHLCLLLYRDASGMTK
ncbi:hypothetical protein [uncultured Chryseobacterium sp.]|uniref:hypothetical protein n=1 Tax=uncultured Chryseobacterium sp. TaxID=259322 RepID=UPI002586BF1F|nr:hypothetical protein [uncultured Chryseobacterium sp.]